MSRSPYRRHNYDNITEHREFSTNIRDRHYNIEYEEQPPTTNRNNYQNIKNNPNKMPLEDLYSKEYKTPTSLKKEREKGYSPYRQIPNNYNSIPA